jgi:hypothetical protein
MCHYIQSSPASVATRKISSLRAFQPVFSTWRQTEGASSNSSSSSNAKQSWTAAAALAGGSILGAGTIAACDANTRRSNVLDPKTFPTPDDDVDEEDVTVRENENPSKISTSNGLKDPMTIYAKMAVKQALKENQEPAGADQQGTALPAPTAQATSPNQDRQNRVLEEQKEALKEHDALAHMTPEELKIEEATRKAKQHSGGLKLFSGNGNMALSLEICRYLGINLGKATVGKFADGECNVVVHENVRGKDCYIIQPTCPPVNDNIMELLLMVSTLRRASARRITVVIPYYGYARQDRKMQVRFFFWFLYLMVTFRIIC